MERLIHSEITQRILNCAIEVHRQLGPGLLESAYRACVMREMSLQGLRLTHETAIPVTYKGALLATGYRADLIVEDRVIVELKAVDKLMPIHEAQLLTYLRLSGLHVGLLLNFNVPALRNGIRRMVL